MNLFTLRPDIFATLSTKSHSRNSVTMSLETCVEVSTPLHFAGFSRFVLFDKEPIANA